ncbi:LPXTG-motif cell wall anchor domain-containing protein [Colletotrichum higginsianum]|nr:LPXTG-motif cell wall anchor domain-containing protein [Colletotrichum higginsianum]
MATATAATTAPAVPAPAPAPGSGFDAAGHAPTLNPTLSSSASVSASASTTDDASPSSSFSFSSSQSAVAFHTPSGSATSSANSPSSPYHAHRLSHNSSKLPAFRFADLHKQHQHHPRLVLPSLLHHIPPPPSPVSPKSQAPSSQNRPTDTVADTDTDTDTAIGIGIGITTATDSAFPTTLPTTTSDLHDHQRPQHKFADQSDNNIYSPQDTRPTSLGLSHGRHPSHRQLSQLSPRISSPIHELPESPPKLSPRSRASTYQSVAQQPIPAVTSVSPRRPASYPDSPVIVQSLPPRRDVADPKTTALPARLQSRRAATSRSRESNATDPESPPPPVAETGAAHPSDTTDDALPSPADRTTKDWAQGQPTAAAAAAATTTTPTASVRVAPIRSFRSSGSRRSLGLDSSTSTMRSFDFGDDLADSNQRDRTLRALEGRRDDDYSQMTQPLSTDADDTTGDVFMKIARQEPTRRGSGDVAPAEQPSAIRDANGRALPK